MLEFGAKILAACQYLFLSIFMVVVRHSSSSSSYFQILYCTFVPTPPPIKSEKYWNTAPLACLSVPTCDVDRVGDGDPPQPLHTCWQSSNCPPLTSTVHFGGVKVCIIIINPSNHNVDLNKVKYKHRQCLIIIYILLSPPVPCTPMLFPPHSYVWQILHPALSVVPGTAPSFPKVSMSKLRASVTWTPW